MILRCGLSKLGTNIQDITVNCFGQQLRVKILDHPVEPNVVTVVFSDYIVSHFLDFEHISIVQVHKVATYKG